MILDVSITFLLLTFPNKIKKIKEKESVISIDLKKEIGEISSDLKKTFDSCNFLDPIFYPLGFRLDTIIKREKKLVWMEKETMDEYIENFYFANKTIKSLSSLMNFY